MKHSIGAFAVILAVALSPRTAATLDAQDRPGELRPLDPPAVPPAQPDPRDVQEMSETLSRAIERGWQSLHLLTRCPSSTRLDSVEVFGSGVGVWNSSRQFDMPSETIRRMLSLLRDAGFAAMPVAAGGEAGSPGR
jgi:hypothetical protein